MISDEKEIDIYSMGLEELVNFIKSQYTDEEWNNRPKRDIPAHNYNIKYVHRMAIDKAKCKIYLALKKKSPTSAIVKRLSTYYKKTFWCKKTGRRKYLKLPPCDITNQSLQSPVVDTSNSLYGVQVLTNNYHYHVAMDLIQHADISDMPSIVKDLSAARRECYEALDDLEGNILDRYYANQDGELPTDPDQLKFLEDLKKKHSSIRQITAFLSIPPPGIEQLFISDTYITTVKYLVYNRNYYDVLDWVTVCYIKLVNLEKEILKAYNKVTCFFNEDLEKLKFLEMLKRRAML